MTRGSCHATARSKANGNPVTCSTRPFGESSDWTRVLTPRFSRGSAHSCRSGAVSDMSGTARDLLICAICWLLWFEDLQDSIG